MFRLAPGQLRGIAVISGAERPPGVEDLDYPGVCALLTEHAAIVVPEDGPQVIAPCEAGYALIALADPHGRKLTAVTIETDKAREAISRWRDGIPYGDDFALTNDTIVAYVRGWPVPTVANPELDVTDPRDQ
ncbi:hypothetical protein EBO15_20740 [Actinomadura harenae]|uniref:Uncharacterized protein n=1 Tax=Actinomadura harenae TaxID=2483351 RepID=A0A3M2LXC2_9ACTN|nr:hypothetical protein EBO15_20740 [Actinomadura harenae]